MSSIVTIPGSDIIILSLDEWWIREFAVENQPGARSYTGLGRPHPLLSISLSTMSPEGDGVEKNSKVGSKYWLFETEKASIVREEEGPNDSNKQLLMHTLAVPNYMDFGLFCINMDNGIWKKCSINEKHTFDENPVACFKQLPRVWAVWDGSKFVGRDSDKRYPLTVVDFLKRTIVGNEHKNVPFIGFAFDMETVSTAVCTYFEFCWDFGADEDFLIHDALAYMTGAENDKKTLIENSSATIAMKFLQYLVKEGLMPARTTLDDCKSALFSRQWYSTMADLASRSDEHERVNLFAIPFFPIGLIGSNFQDPKVFTGTHRAIRKALEDEYRRFERLLERVLYSVTYRCAENETEELNQLLNQTCKTNISIKIKSLQKDVMNVGEINKILEELDKAGKHLRDIVNKSPVFSDGYPLPKDLPIHCQIPPDFIAASRLMDDSDVNELIKWHDFRLALIKAQLEGRDLIDLAYNIEDSNSDELPGFALTGYSCSGSWMVGVLRPSRSISISQKVIEEMTAPKSAWDRADLGAGIPSRKDFFEFHGSSRVTYAEHLTWSNLLRFTGSRARRRDRTVCTGVHVSSISDCIYGQLMHCLRIAEISSDQSTINTAAMRATEAILHYIAEAMQNAWSRNERHGEHCRVCRNHDKCALAFRNSCDCRITSDGSQ